MPHIRLDDNEIELSVGELRIGTGDDAGVRVDSSEVNGNIAIISVDPRGTATVRRAATGPTILVNGVALGAEPAPLLHGDRIEVAGRQLRFSDDRKAGSTVLMPALGAPSAAAPATNRARAAATGGRLVSLVDGREYAVPAAGLRIGRDAGCDIVVPGDAVSRQHAEISVTTSGYVVRDVSANGVYVNGARTGDAHPLRRGDVIRVGTEEFRFYGDAVPEPVAAPALPPVLATLEVVNEGAAKGTLYEIRSPLTHLGRGPHNDVVVNDGSVSDAHAKLQRREAGWFVVDVGSTNGTYVAGKRIENEARLEPNAAVRFGGVKVIFREQTATSVADGGTRVIVAAKRPDQQRAPAARPTVAPRHANASESVEPTRGVPALVWIAAAVVIGAAILFVIQDR
jgi:pSer/pThr/pTyr-binding forkhead associated (FHA) protein